jgi:hypothetical protein
MPSAAARHDATRESDRLCPMLRPAAHQVVAAAAAALEERSLVCLGEGVWRYCGRVVKFSNYHMEDAFVRLHARAASGDDAVSMVAQSRSRT